MFCSNCGKTIRPEDDACRHCGASLGEGRFYGNTYTSSQVRLPAESLNDAPEGGMISYTRINYMTDYTEAVNDPDAAQPEQDVHTGTNYRPLLSDEEDLTRIEAEEAAAEAEAAAQQAAAEEAVEADEFGGAESAEAPVSEESADEEPTDEAEFEEPAPAEDEYAEEAAEDIPGAEDEEAFEESTSPLPHIAKAAISPRVLSYMAEMEEKQQRRAGGGSMRMPSFLNGLKKKDAPVSEEELPEAEDIASDEEAYADDTAYAADDAAQTGADYANDTAYADEAAAYDEAAYAEDEDAYAADGSAEEYVSDEENDGYGYYEEDAEEAQEGGLKSKFDLSKLSIDIKGLLQNRILTIALASVLIVAVIAAGIVWLNFVTTKRSKIVDVTYNTYTQGIELLKGSVSTEYRDEMESLYLTNTAVANESFTKSISDLNALMPEEPAANDELFITSLTIIQDVISEAIKADADAVLNGTEAQNAADSELRWQAIENAVNKLAEATNPGELTVIVSDLESVVVPTPSPSPTPTKSSYETLTNGMMDSLQVKLMQNRLINLGYLSGEADGDFGPGTENAVKAFQRAAGLTADGVATPEMQERLFAEDAPRTGATADTTAAPDNPSAE